MSRSQNERTPGGSWRNWLARYGLALGLYAATVGLSVTILYLETRVNLTIPIVFSLVAAAWYGGRGPGLVVAVLFQTTTLIFAPVSANSTIPQAIFSHFSVFALYVFVVLVISGLKRVLDELRRERDRLKSSERFLASRTRELSSLYEFTDRSQHARRMEEVYEAALDSMFTVLGCDRGSILLFDTAGVMRFVASRGLSKGYQNEVEGHSPWSRNEKDPKPFGISDLAEAQIDEDLRSTIRNEGISSLGFIPLVSDNRLTGKMMVYYDAPHTFNEAEFDLAMTVGNQIASGVQLKRTQTQLVENEERFRLATATGKVGVWDWHVRDDRIEWTDTVYEMHGIDKGSFEGGLDAFEKLVHPDDREWIRKRIGQALSGEVPYDVQFRLLRPDGVIRILFTNAVVLRDANGPYRMIGATVDITDRLKYEEARRESEIMRRLVEAQEAERHRIARDLHDHLGQRMTALRLKIESVARELADDLRISNTIKEVQNAALQVDRDIGFLAWELRPTELERFGLVDALQTFVREWSQQNGISAEFDVIEAPIVKANRRLPTSVETNLFRIVQEALNNAFKHSGADAVSVLFQHRKNDLVLIIEDNGCGFESSSIVPNGNGSRGLGLIGMKERAAVIKGTLEIDSSAGKGTTVIARVPVQRTG